MHDLSRIDILAVIGNDTTLHRVASTKGGEHAGPCPFCGGRDRFRVWPDHPDGKGRWWCRQCEHWGDAVDYIQRREGLEFGEALERLGMMYTPSAHKLSKPAATYRHTPPPSDTWQERARALIAYAQEQLWGKIGRKALFYLREERGLADETIRLWGLGWCPGQRDGRPLADKAERWGLEDKPVYLHRGVVIPCTVADEVWHIKIRCFDQKGRPIKTSGNKYRGPRGGKAALFGLDSLTGKQVVVICEGELDGMLLWQEANDLVDIVALGSKAAKPTPRALAQLVGATHWLVALDRDAHKEADWWEEYSPRVRRIRPLQGNDLTDFHQAGGSLRAWIEYHLTRLGSCR